MDRKSLVLPLAFGAMFSAGVQADALDYNYLQLGYVTADFSEDFVDVSGNGVALEGSASINDNFHVFAGYGTMSFDWDVDTSEWEVGLGYSRALGQKTDLVATLGYVSAEVEIPYWGSLDDDGYTVGLGLRSMITDRFELEGKANYVNLSDSGSDTAFTVQLGYDLSESWQMGGGLTTSDGDTAYHFGVRFYFGK